MTRNVSIEEVRYLRLRAQSLLPENTNKIATAAELIQMPGGLQSQELSAGYLGIRARTHGYTSDDVKNIREIQRSIVLTWAMRGTMHLIAAEDFFWMMPFFGPRFIKNTARRYRQLGLGEDIRTKAGQVIREEIQGRALIRKEIAQILDAQGIPVAGQAIAHLVRWAALEGIICFGPEREGELTYVLVDDWLSPPKTGAWDEKRVLAELARRYFGAYNPASVDDFAKWVGISLKEARTGFDAISGEIEEVLAMGTPAWMIKDNMSWLDDMPKLQNVRLLPRYDNYLLGYTSREFMVADAYARRIHPGGGQIQQSVIENGRAIATWRMKKRKISSIIIEPFEQLSKATIPQLEAEVGDIGRFLGTELRMEVQS